ncbi:phosphoadenosine phosphosulfate reductase [Spirochaetia bacterium]|nr:phosphoadenosine phosphosulfate reductase [Spirochaetia bacterium]
MNENYLPKILEKINGTVGLSFSYQAEDLVVLDLLQQAKKQNSKLDIEVFTLDTGKLFGETDSYHKVLEDHFKISIKRYFPDPKALELIEKEIGDTGMQESLEKRHKCCGVRKVDVLEKAIIGKSAWLTGMRAAQSVTRTDIQLLEFDEKFGVFKVNPLYKWSYDEVMAYIKNNALPIHPLYAKGFLSIGCYPCTRAVKTGEDIRAGRWWWERADCKECGLHIKEKPAVTTNIVI